jgi:hypothetical protein
MPLPEPLGDLIIVSTSDLPVRDSPKERICHRHNQDRISVIKPSDRLVKIFAPPTIATYWSLLWSIKCVGARFPAQPAAACFTNAIPPVDACLDAQRRTSLIYVLRKRQVVTNAGSFFLYRRNRKFSSAHGRRFQWHNLDFGQRGPARIERACRSSAKRAATGEGFASEPGFPAGRDGRP